MQTCFGSIWEEKKYVLSIFMGQFVLPKCSFLGPILLQKTVLSSDKEEIFSK